MTELKDRGAHWMPICTKIIECVDTLEAEMYAERGGLEDCEKCIDELTAALGQVHKMEIALMDRVPTAPVDDDALEDKLHTIQMAAKADSLADLHAPLPVRMIRASQIDDMQEQIRALLFVAEHLAHIASFSPHENEHGLGSLVITYIGNGREEAKR